MTELPVPAQVFRDYCKTTEARIHALECEVQLLKELVTKQSQTIGLALQRIWGPGSTVKDGDYH